MTEKAGIKYDENKLRFDLIDPHFHKDVAEVLSFGAAQYGENNWKGLEDARNRYIGAAERHLNAIKRGEIFDEESGLPHAAHLGCNAMFLHYLDRVTEPHVTECPQVCEHFHMEEISHVTRQDIATETQSGWVKRINKGIRQAPCSSGTCESFIRPADEYYEAGEGDELQVVCVACHDVIEAEAKANGN